VLLTVRSGSEGLELDLIRRAQGGDRAAFEELVNRYYGRIQRWAQSIVGDRDDADDVAQEVLIRLYRRLRTYEGKSRFTTWLFQVTRNTALELRRKADRRNTLLSGFWRTGQEETDVHAEPLARLQATHAVSQVKEVFNALPVRQRQVFDLADLQGYSHAEIAEMLGINAVTVRANLCKARRAIRGKMLERFRETVEELNA